MDLQLDANLENRPFAFACLTLSPIMVQVEGQVLKAREEGVYCKESKAPYQ